jgi:hypothetical protein
MNKADLLNKTELDDSEMDNVSGGGKRNQGNNNNHNYDPDRWCLTCSWKGKDSDLKGSNRCPWCHGQLNTVIL